MKISKLIKDFEAKKEEDYKKMLEKEQEDLQQARKKEQSKGDLENE